MHFSKLSLYITYAFTQNTFCFKNPKSGSSTTSHTLNTKNEWLNYNNYVVAMEEKEWDEKNIRNS
jgi:hypothetical protein